MTFYRNTWFGSIFPILIGALLAFLVMFGLVMSRSAAPDTNPAAKAAIVYGE